MDYKEEKVDRQNDFLIADIFANDAKFQAIREQFKHLLLGIRAIAEKDSDVACRKRKKVDQFKTTIMDCSGDSSKDVTARVQEWDHTSTKERFLIYKESDGWTLYGRNIVGKRIQKSIDRLSEEDADFKNAFLKLLQGHSQQGDLAFNHPLHSLVVDFFGYLRPAIFFSYSWPDPNNEARTLKDEYNRKVVHAIAKDLIYAGFRVLLDKDDLFPGHDLDNFMNLITDSRTDYICIMATPLYKTKYLNPSLTLAGDYNKTYVEAKSILSHADSNENFRDRLFTFLLEGEAKDSLPGSLETSKIFCKFTTNDYFRTLLRMVLKAYDIEESKNQAVSALVREFDKKWRPVKLESIISPMKDKPVFIFTDPGVDDFAALGLALAPKAFTVKAIVACAGNIELEKTVSNTLDICHLANRKEIPIFRGSKSQMSGNPIHTDYEAHGDNGLNQFNLERAAHSYEEGDTTETLIKILRSTKSPITLISLSGLTDVALLLKKAAELKLLDKIAGISMMGGVFDFENANAPKRVEKFEVKYGEFNFLSDPDATKLVFDICQSRANPIPVILFDLDFTHHNCRFTQVQTTKLRRRSPNRLSLAIADALDVIPPVYRARFPNDPPSQPVHDIFPVMALLEPALFEGEYVHIHCQSSEGDSPGQVELVEDEKSPKVFRVRAIPKLKQEAFFDKYVEVVSSYSLPAASISASHQPSMSSSNSNSQAVQQSTPSRKYGAASPSFFKEGESAVAESSRGQDASASTGKASEQGEDRRPTVVTRTVTYLSAPESLDSTQGRGWLELASQFAPPKSQLKGEPNHEIVTPVYLQPGSSKQSDLGGPINK